MMKFVTGGLKPSQKVHLDSHVSDAKLVQIRVAENVYGVFALTKYILIVDLIADAQKYKAAFEEAKKHMENNKSEGEEETNGEKGKCSTMKSTFVVW